MHYSQGTVVCVVKDTRGQRKSVHRRMNNDEENIYKVVHDSPVHRRYVSVIWYKDNVPNYRSITEVLKDDIIPIKLKNMKLGDWL